MTHPIKKMEEDSSIFVAGHRGLAGSAIVRRLRAEGHKRLILCTRDELDLLDQSAVRNFFKQKRIEFVFLAAARVGGIHANATYPADFLYENLMIAANVIHAAAESQVDKLLFLGSSCIYPRLAPQPIREESLLTDSLEKTNEAYAIAKIAGLKLCAAYQKQYGKRFISAMPTNLYGPNDSFHPENSHVIPGMMRRFHEATLDPTAKEVVIWGTGSPLREFLHVDDLARALYLLMQRYESPEPINVGTGYDLSIREVAQTLQRVTQFKGGLRFDKSMPDGTPRKVLDVSRIQSLGWKAQIGFNEGLRQTYDWARENQVF